MLWINNILHYCTKIIHKNTEENKLINNVIKKTTVIFLLSCLIYGCSPDKVHKEPNIPFQCVTSQTTCEVTTTLGIVVVNFNVNKVLTELPFKIRVAFKKDFAEKNKIASENKLKVSGYMEGKTMFMGKIPLFFIQNEQNIKKEQFIAETMLGSCSEDSMTWRAWITLEQQEKGGDKKQTTFFIDFDSSRF